MRKLTKLATAATAALTLMAVATAPASADQAFWMTSSSGAYCNPYCDDAGYTGTLPGATLGPACQASFDIRVELEGEIETRNTEVLCPTGGWGGGYYNVEECDHTWGPGQMVIPDEGQPYINLDICLRHGGYPQGQGGIEVNHNITFDIYSGPRRWEQSSTDVVTDNDPTEGPFSPIVNGYFQDTIPGDNVRVEFL